jgi:xylan 1,4-beta-xylosidase
MKSGAMTNPTVRNPILPGFHPDPSIVRVGADYYLANSTFEWFPGIRLHHSRDLRDWQPVGHALTDEAMLPLRGVPDSGGVWAPSLSYHNGRYWLVYAVVYTTAGPFKDMDILLVSASSIMGPWSQPIHLGGGGFDPSVFHDDDGRSWLVNISWDARPDRSPFAGIVLQELDLDRGCLVGEQRRILTHDELVEGPNLYRHGGWYYLMLAEGGTGWNHGILMARSRTIDGPYTLDPDGSLLTSRDNPGLSLQKAGHGEIVQTPTGEWYLVHLASRPVLARGERRSMLGRETCLQRVRWTEDGWLRLANGTHWPDDHVELPGVPADTSADFEPSRDDFTQSSLSVEWNSLRQPMTDSWVNLTERPGWLRLRGRQSLQSRFSLSLVARRLTSTQLVVTTSVDCAPMYPGQHAGLVFWYDTTTHFFLGVTGSECGPRILLASTDDGHYKERVTDIEVRSPVQLRGALEGAHLRFSVSFDGEEWQAVGPVLDASVLSDDYGSALRFTGAFVGLAAVDSHAARLPADFAFFEMRTIPYDGSGDDSSRSEQPLRR